MRCARCGGPLGPDDVPLTLKLISRGAGEFLCLHCLAEFFGCSTALLQEKAAQFRREGCSLFTGTGED